MDIRKDLYSNIVLSGELPLLCISYMGCHACASVHQRRAVGCRLALCTPALAHLRGTVWEAGPALPHCACHPAAAAGV